MCLRNVYYPLVVLEDNKKKVLFNYYIEIKNRDDFPQFLDLQRQCDYARFGLSKYISLNNLFNKEHIKGVEKMVQIPCGQCRECLNDISRQWAFRIMYEASKYDNNYFITFTYNDDMIPDNRMLDSLFFQNFNKKLKKYLTDKKLKSDFRFYGVGEYGSTTYRPHYHCIYFNLDIPDLKFEYIDSNKNLHFSSEFLSNVYKQSVLINGKKESVSIGFIDIAGVDIGSACYVARYCDKKRRLTKNEKEDLVSKGVVPEFSAMSRRPGIGADFLNVFLEDFKNGVYKHYIKGKSFSLPLYYNKKIKDLLKGTKELELYEEKARLNMSVKLTRQLELADFVGDLSEYNKEIDQINKRGSL